MQTWKYQLSASNKITVNRPNNLRHTFKLNETFAPRRGFIYYFITKQTARSQILNQQGDRPKSLSVLLAEDNIVNQRVAAALLERIGHRVTICNNGREVVRAVAHADFDLVLMDIQMPVLDGLRATAQIRALADPVKARIPIFAISANVRDLDIDHYRSFGIDDILSKPLRPEQLSSLLARRGAAEVAELPEQLLDENQIGALRDAVAPQKLAELYAMARLSLSTSHQALQLGWQNGDRGQIKAAAHRMAGVARNFGCLALGLCAARIEDDVQRGGDGRSQTQAVADLLAASLKALP